ncbi:serine/threonine protein phosphatase [Macrococcoides canis]|nr:serine/threonine protein phosphatase [Macrococcus canis]
MRMAEMNYFIVGDVHGCFFTLKKIMKHWKKGEEQLIFVGDYINKGCNSRDVVYYIRKLCNMYPDTVCIKGNHEYKMVQYMMQHTPKSEMKENYRRTLSHYPVKKFDSDIEWMHSLPLYYENDVLYVTHAGVNWLNFRKFSTESSWCVLRYRGKLKNMHKLQVIGHTPTESGKPEYDKKRNILNIDTGAGNYEHICAVRINKHGKLVDSYLEKVVEEDKY